MTEYKIGSLGWLRDKAKEYGFGDNIKEFVKWAQQNGIIRSITQVNRESNDKTAKKAGYENWNEYVKYNSWRTGLHKPMNEYFPIYFGINIGEKLFKSFLEEIIFEYVKWTGKCSNDEGIDFICKNPKQEFLNRYPQFKLIIDKEYRIQLKLRRLIYEQERAKWEYSIEYNNLADYFILSGWSNEEILRPMYIWMIQRDEIVKYGKGNGIKRPFYKRSKFSITNKPNYLKEFEKYELKYDLEKLKELYNKMNKGCDTYATNHR